MIKINKDAIRKSHKTAVKSAKANAPLNKKPKISYKILAFGLPNFNKHDDNVLVYVDKSVHGDRLYSEIAKEMARFTDTEEHVLMVDADALKEFQFTYAVDLPNGLQITLPKNNVAVFKIKTELKKQ